MTKDELLNYELVHRNAGNAFACVEILDDNWIRIASKFGNEKRAWLAAVSQMSVFEISPGYDFDKKPYPKEPKKLTDEELFRIKPIRDGIANGSLKVIGTHITAVKPTPKI